MIKRIHKLSAYVFWSALGAMIPLLVDRFLVHPALAGHLSEDAFGGLVWALGLTTMVGAVSGNGFAILLMRKAAKLDDNTTKEAYSTSLFMTAWIAPILLGFTAIISLPFALDAVKDNSLAIYLTLCTYSFFRTLEIILNVNLRIRRRFKTLFILRIVEAGALCTNLAFVQYQSFWIIGAIYILSSLLPFATNLALSRSVISSKAIYATDTRKWLMSGWIIGALITLLDQSQVHLARILLGILTDGEQVAYFYCGVAMANVFIMPISIVANVALSLLGGRKDFVLRGGRATIYFILATGTACAVGFASWFFGYWLVGVLYPKFAEYTWQFYHWIAVATGCKALFILLRPVAIKYANLKYTTILIALTLGLQIIALLLLVPSQGAAGAAKALAWSGILATITWCVYYAHIVRQQRYFPLKQPDK